MNIKFGKYRSIFKNLMGIPQSPEPKITMPRNPVYCKKMIQYSNSVKVMMCIR